MPDCMAERSPVARERERDKTIRKGPGLVDCQGFTVFDLAFAWQLKTSGNPACEPYSKDSKGTHGQPAGRPFIGQVLAFKSGEPYTGKPLAVKGATL